MIAWLTRLFRRTPYAPQEPPDTPATRKARHATARLAATDRRIERTMEQLRDRHDDRRLLGWTPADEVLFPRHEREGER